MKYKHVFFIWLLADIFLAVGVGCYMFYDKVNAGSSDDFGMFLLLTGSGIGVSLPSLITMSIFYFVFKSNAKDPEDYRLSYIALIICINILYMGIGQLMFGM